MSTEQFASLVQNYCDIFESSLQNQIAHCDANLYSDDDEYPYFDEIAYLKNRDDDIWKMFSREVFTIFWQLELQDIVDPESMYTEFIKRKNDEFESRIASKEEEKKAAQLGPMSKSEQNKKRGMERKNRDSSDHEAI